MKIYLAPLQGFTEYAYRKAYQKVFGSIDLYYLPYAQLENNGRIRNKYKRDICKENNIVESSVPQVLCNSSDELIFWADHYKNEGYTEMNLNLGCPYPMVTNRGKGSALLDKPDLLNDILQRYYDKTDFTLSVKMRLGYKSDTDFLEISEILNDYPLKNVIVHPRTAKQMYKGEVDVDKYLECKSLLKHDTIFNGDVNSVERLNELKSVGAIDDEVMMGRGVLKNPYLPALIKGEKELMFEENVEMIKELHSLVLEEYYSYLNDDNQVLTHIKPFWDYLSEFFPAELKLKKKIKKASNMRKYMDVVNSTF